MKIIVTSKSYLKINTNCRYKCKFFVPSYRKEDLELLGDYGFGAHKQFANEAKMAVRLANFISAFLQVIHFVYNKI